jgi:tRNA pseudouridine55 synthase
MHAAGQKTREPNPGGINGILVVDKPADWTSHDVVAKLRWATGIRRIGHAGTLDPLATGLLPICIGQATRVVEYLMDLPKAYRVRMKLGEETDTEDAEGALIRQADPSGVREADVRDALLGLRGPLEQVPPMYSALKKDGEPLYKYARRGKAVKRPPRRVTIYDIGEIAWESPFVSFRVRCSKGTYVRSLCRDIGRHLGVGAHLTALRRTESAGFTEEDAHPLLNLLALDPAELLERLVPMDRPLSAFESLVVRPELVGSVCRGQMLQLMDLIDPPAALGDGIVRLYDPEGRFLALGRCTGAGGGAPVIYPKKVLCSPGQN